MAGTPPRKKKSAKPKPAPGLMGWLGRQVGHVKKAVKTDVTNPPPPRKPVPKPKPAVSPAPPSNVIYRDDKIEEIDHPTQPGVKLRRTIIDEVIVDGKEKSE